MPLPPTCDIFCTVIDNYGDIGVSWRLARQLANEYGIAVRLWLDDLSVLRYLCADVVPDAMVQRVAGVEVRPWRQPFVEVEPAGLVVEAFACELPNNYVQAMARADRPPLWVNLEYLSAEPWVADCHGLPSPQPYGLQKYFFFPGFTDRTGGLLRERELLHQRRAWQIDGGERATFFARFGIDVAPGARAISLFAYANSVLPTLLATWASAAAPVWCLVPAGKPVADIAGFFGESTLAVGAIRRRGALTVVVLPFLTQDDYDRLLWSCDINFVRGEDSFVRAQWAGRPLIWHIYPQSDGAHWHKLNAFLDLYGAALPAAAAASLRACWQAWNGAGDINAAWRALETSWPLLAIHAQQWCERLAEQRNLAAALAQFCANHV